MKNTFQTSLAVAGLCVLTGAALSPAQAQYRGGDDSYNAGRAVTREPNAGLEARVETDRTQYSTARAIEITLSLTNVSRYDTSLTMPGRGLPYELTVRDGRSGRTVYTLDQQRSASNGRQFRLSRDETRTWRELWDGRNDDGDRVPPGVYIVEARIARQRAVSTQIYIGNGGSRPGRPGRGDDEGSNNGGNPERPDWPSRPPRGGGDSDDLPGNNRGNFGSYNDLRATLISSRTVVRAGDSVRLTFTVQNGGSRPVNVLFSSGQQWDVTATGPNGRRVWRESDGKFTTQALSEITLRPGTDRTFTTNWQVPTSLPGGQYDLQAGLTVRRTGSGGINNPVAPASLTLRIIGSGDRNNDRGGNDGNDNYSRRDNQDDDRYNRHGNPDGEYTNPSNRTPSGTVLGGPTIIYGSRLGATLVSPRILLGRDGTQYVGKKVTVSGQYSGTTGIANQKGWLLGGEGVILSVIGTPPNVANGTQATVTGIVRQTPSGQVYLALP